MPLHNYPGTGTAAFQAAVINDLNSRVGWLEDQFEIMQARLSTLERALAKPGSVIYVEKHEVPFPPRPDPRIGHLCWVWDNGSSNRHNNIRRVVATDDEGCLALIGEGPARRWDHAELIRPEEL